MKIVFLNGQMTFYEMKGSLEHLPKSNRWVKMSDALPWTEFEKVYNQRLNNGHAGASNKPGRLVIGALIIKHKLNLSDEETIFTIQENPYMQYMCGLTEYTDKPIFDPSARKGLRKPIIERGRIRKEYHKVIKRRHKGGKLINGALDRMLPLLYRDILTLLNLIGVNEVTYNFLNRTEKRTLQAVIDMYHQQEEMHREGTHTCEDRIISIHQPHLRPIVRGKAKAKTEFGSKIGVSIVSGCSFIDHHSWNAYNESSDPDVHLRLFGERFGSRPKRFFGDKIYLNRENRKKLKEKEIEIMGPPLWRPPKNPSPEQIEREKIGTGLRNQAEAQFGIANRVYRANNIRAKLPQTAECWTAMCYFVKNLTKFMGELCRVLIEMLSFVRHFCLGQSNFTISTVRVSSNPRMAFCS